MKDSMRTYYMYLFLFLMAAAIFIPLYVSVMGGFKTVGELRTNALGLPSNWNFDNYLSVLLNSKFWLYLWNSVIYAIGTTFFVLLFASMTAFVFAHVKFAGNRFLYNYFLLGLLFPFATAILPLFLRVRDFGLLGTSWAVILPQIAFGLGFAIILTLLGYDNYKKTGIFYVMPLQTKGAHYGYLIVQIYNKKNELKLIDQLQKSEEEWKVKNNYSEDNFQSRYDLGNFQQKKAIKIILNNKIITMQIYLKKIIHHAVLNPFQTFYWHKYNQKDYYGIEFHLSKESKKYFIFKIFYSLIFYIILFVGIFSFIKKRNKLDFHLLIFFLVLYLVFMLGWVGNSRYFIPSVVFLSIFFGHGLNYFNKLRYKKS